MARKYFNRLTKGNMSDYYRDQGYKEHKKLRRAYKALFILFFLAVFAGIAYFIYDIYRESKVSDTASAPSAPVSSTVVSGNTIQTSPYFQFQAPTKWRSIANETKDGHYVYRQFNNQLVEQEFVIDVNSQSPDILPLVQTTRVLAVSIKDGGSFTTEGVVSDHCKKAVKPGTEKTAQIVTMNKVSFACSPDSTSYKIVVGLAGGTSIMTLPRPGGKTAPYKITYRSLSALPNTRDFMNIVKTFETR